MFPVTDYSHKLFFVQLTKCYDLTSDIPSGCSAFIVSCDTLFRFSGVSIILKITFFPPFSPMFLQDSLPESLNVPM